MDVPARRGYVIDTFVAKELAKGSRTMLDNTRTYRALQGEKFEWREPEIPEDDPIVQWYEDFISTPD